VKRPITDEDQLERAAIDGRVVFAIAVFLCIAGLVALLDRVGVPERFVELLGPVLAVVGLATVGVLLRTMRVSRFYAGGRVMPPVYAGLAMASLAAGLFLPFLPPVPNPLSLTGLLIGFSCGLALAALFTAPLLRKTGAFSTPDFIAARFPNVALRLGVATVVAAAGLLIGFAGLGSAVNAFSDGLDAPRDLSIVVVMVTIILIAAPGGLAGAAWAAAAASGIFVTGLGLPMMILKLRGGTLPMPVIGDSALWETALGRMAQWQGATSDAATATGAMTIAAIALGLAALAPLLAPAITTANSGMARRAGVATLFWGVVFAVVIAATMAVAALAFDRGLTGARPGELSDFILTASSEGRVQICGAHPSSAAAAQAACAAKPGFSGVLRPTDIVASGAFLVQALPNMRGFGRAFSGLAVAGLMAVALTLAAAGFYTFATALGHDAFYRVRDATAMTSRRLAVTRMLLIGSVIAGAVLLRYSAPDPRALIGLAIALCASAIAPLLLLALWPRAEGSDATVALLAGLATAETMIFIAGVDPSIEVFAPASVVAACVSLIAGVGASLFRRADPTSHGGAFVHDLLHGEAEVLDPDKGA
jgi:cation/acetate symporter